VSHAGGDVSHAGGELERRQETIPERPAGNLPVPYRRGDVTRIIDWPEFAAWTRNRGVPLAGLLLIAAQLIWKSAFLSHYFFRQDDFHVFELALGHPFNWKYLSFVGAGHLIPGVYAIAWVLVRTSLYSWPLASAVTVVIVACADLAALRLLRTLFGSRPAILVPLAVYLLCPLTMPDTGWWSSAVESLPLQLATFMALNAQVCYVRTRRMRHAFAAAAWLLAGLAFFEKAMVLPLLLLGVTSGFLTEGPWLRAVGRSLARYWRAWVLQLLVLAGYAAVLVTSLRTSSVQPGIPGTSAGVSTFVSEIVKDTLLPGAVGGPWQWFPSPDAEYAYSAPPTALAWLAVLVAVGVAAASIWSRRHAWRAWALLAGWVAAADVAPVLLGRISELGPTVLGLETRYVADAVPVLAVCLGLAFWPVAGQREDPRRHVAAPGSQAGRMVGAAAVGAFVIGSVWSVQAYQNVTSSVPDRVYIANARVAVADAPNGTVIADQPVPPALMLGIFGQDAYASRVIEPMESAAAARRISWTRRPDGTIDHLMVFGSDGRLHEAAVYGQTSAPSSVGRRCQKASHGQVVARFLVPSGAHSQVLRVAYLAAPAAGGAGMTVTYGGATQRLAVRPGLHSAYLPVHGSSDAVTVSGPAAAGLCVGEVQAGIIVPAGSGPVIPAAY
jgi:hypothetical protein